MYDVDVKGGDPDALRLEQQDFLGGWVGGGVVRYWWTGFCGWGDERFQQSGRRGRHAGLSA